MDLLIVESPAKAKTIGRFLEKNVCVEACMGHVRDLPRSKLGVDVKDDFKPTYVKISGRSKTIKMLKEKAAKAEKIYLGADHDREGEAICWHLKEMLGKKNGFYRVAFNEITPDSIRDAFESPGSIDLCKVNAQQARRILDRLVGYMVSPVLWKKVRKGASAGRVQSVALRLICEREVKIEAFTPEEYWSVTAEFKKGSGEKFNAKLEKIGKAKANIPDEKKAQSIVQELKGADFVVNGVEQKKGHKAPPPPFTTSTLQQEASRLLGYRAARTMRVAQQLYEGLDVGKGDPAGLITYMRTDSVRVSKEAQNKSLRFIHDRFGADFVPDEAQKYKSKKGAQEAHEAIRPTDVEMEPAKVREHLTDDQFKLYGLIWCRFMASQCKPALLNRTKVSVTAGKFEFSARGVEILFPGFIVVYSQVSSGRQGMGGKEVILPSLKEGEALDLAALSPKQHFTKPPARYSEGTLVKALEEKGIGRPSTYAPIINTIQERFYVERESGRLVPTKLGIMVNKLLVKNLGDYFNVEFTAEMESSLDKVEDGKLDWVQLIRDFYQPFESSVEDAGKNMENVKKELLEETDEVCDKCGGKMVIRWGRYGKFLSCINFPECKHSRPYVLETGVNCPETACDGKVVKKKSKRGRTFYGCSKYPDCKFVSWYKPVPVKCEKCGADFLVEKKGKSGQILQCIQCDYDRICSEVHNLSGS